MFVLNVLATLPHWGRFFGMDDEAITVLGASRILSGEWPYYHWDTRHTPGSYLLAAPYLALFGTDQWGVRSLMALVAAASGLVILAIGRATLPGRMAFLPWVLWCSGGLTNFPLLNHHWFGTFFSLLSFYFAVLWSQGRRRADWALGVSAALAAWTLQSDGLASALMILLIWLRFRPPGLTRVLAGGVLASLLLWLPFLPCLGEVWRENFGDMQTHLRYNRSPYGWQPWLGLGKLLLHLPPAADALDRWNLAGHFYLLTLTYGLYFVIVAAGLGLLEWRRQTQSLPLAWCMLGWALALGNRQTVSYLSFSCGGIFLMLTALIALLPRAWLWATVVGGLELCFGLGRHLHAGREYVHPINTRAGLYYSRSPVQAQAYEQLRRWSDSYFPPHTKVLSYPYMCSFYTTEKLRNPLRQPVLTPFLYSRAEVERAPAQLQDTEWILYVPLDAEVMEQSYFISADLYARVAEEELAIMARDYTLFQQAGSLRLYRRRVPSGR